MSVIVAGLLVLFLVWLDRADGDDAPRPQLTEEQIRQILARPVSPPPPPKRKREAL